DAVPGDVAARADFQSAPAVKDAHGGEVAVMADLDPAFGVAGGDVSAREKVDVVFDDQPPGRALDEAVWVEADVAADARDRGAVLHVEAAVKANVVADFEALGVLDEDVVVDEDVVAAGFETGAVIHVCVARAAGPCFVSNLY